ncbi:hypothetical protein AK812_SmicGene17080 [Symbiodinium microadriaticum]|uniref:Uncharacterized protein n=1 Tax=Symbiodinium microadriaticum TaxID=2951 RepID=A0A1Q9DYN3_SYMMI|nr:hypothetical protein AK812_SmicGene17080 [Symbiodinium microadriaticum]
MHKVAFVAERSVLSHKVAFVAERSVLSHKVAFVAERSVLSHKVALVVERSVLSHKVALVAEQSVSSHKVAFVAERCLLTPKVALVAAKMLDVPGRRMLLCQCDLRMLAKESDEAFNVMCHDDARQYFFLPRGNGPAIMLMGVIGVVCVAVAALGRKVKKVTLQAERAAEREEVKFVGREIATDLFHPMAPDQMSDV